MVVSTDAVAEWHSVLAHRRLGTRVMCFVARVHLRVVVVARVDLVLVVVQAPLVGLHLSLQAQV